MPMRVVRLMATNIDDVFARITNAVALAGLTFPAWWPSLEDTSNAATALVPIFSLLWLIIQIVRVLKNWKQLK